MKHSRGFALPIVLGAVALVLLGAAVKASQNLGSGGAQQAQQTSVDASTLTGTVLATNVVTSSLTSVGTLGSLLVTGNTGIGTTSPASKFHIDGENNLTRMILDADVNNARIFSFRTDNLPRWAFRVDGTESGSNTGSDFALRNYNDAGTLIDTPIFVSRSTGNVGLSTTSPFARFALQATTGGTTPLFTIASSTSGAATSTVFHITNNGNVGIGTTNPSSILAVGAGGDAAGTRTAVTVNNAGYAAPSAINATSNGDKFLFWNSSSYKGGIGNASGDLWLQSHGTGVLGTMSFYTGASGSSPSMFIARDGKVGIGSTTPFAQLSLGSGAITTTEYSVSTSTSMTIDWRNGNQQLIRHGTAAATIAHTGFIPGQTLRVQVCNPGASGGAITWSGVLWPAATVPTQTTTADKCDLWTFISTAGTSTPIVIGGANVNY